MIDPNKLKEIQDLVELYHEALVEAFTGPKLLPTEVLDKLEELGVPRWVDVPTIDQSVALGAMLAAIPDPNTDLTVEDYESRLQRRQIPLSEEEANAIEYASTNAARYIRGLGNRVSKDLTQIIESTEQEKRRLANIVREQTQESIKWRETQDELKSRLGHAGLDWARDLERISATELHNAMENGAAAAIVRRHGTIANVAKVPYQDACDYCKALYLDNSGKPRIFQINELLGKTNAVDPNNPHKARKRADWVPTIGPVHPWCRCKLVYVPDGFVFDDDGNMVPKEDEQ